MKLEALLTERAGVRRLVRGLLRDEHDVDDVVQDTWLTAIQNPPEAGRDPRPWLARVARNLALKRKRSEARRTTRERRAARPESMPPSDGIVERARTHRQVVDAVLALDEPCRTTILLRFFEGRTPRRIARETGASVNTVNSRIQRGLVRLRRSLSRDLGVERSALGLALLPLIQTPKGLLMGALIMGAKAKIGLATALVLVATVAIYQLSDGNVKRTKPTQPTGHTDLAAKQNAAPRATTTQPPAKVVAPAAADAPHPGVTSAPATPADTQETLSGTVRSMAGVPLAGATVRATSSSSPLVRFKLEKPLTTTTDARGRFSFTGLDTRLRALVVEASVPGYFGQRRVVLLGESYDFVLGAPGSARGRVTSIRDGSSCAGATVGLSGKLAQDESQRGASPDQPGRNLSHPEPGTRCVPALRTRARSCAHAGCSQGGRAFGPRDRGGSHAGPRTIRARPGAQRPGRETPGRCQGVGALCPGEHGDRQGRTLQADRASGLAHLEDPRREPRIPRGEVSLPAR